MWPFQKINPARSPKTWEASQQYELRHALSFMDSQFFRHLHADYASGKRNVSVGFRDPLVLQEWFSDSTVAFDEFISHIAGRVCLEIGPCVASQMSGWDVARERHVIEPLLDPIINWQRHHLRKSIYDGLIPHSVAAEVFIEQLAQAVDGAILCRNMLDHTPKWPFVLANIAAYAASGCRLLLWTDLDHRGEADEGHYDITSDISAFRRLVQQLGFTIIREHSSPDRDELNWGCFAVRR